MLPLGHLGKGFGAERTTNFTLEEQRTMMTLWCLFGSPLMIGAKLTRLNESTLSLLTNPHILAMRSPDFVPQQIRLTDTDAVWIAKNSATGEVRLALFNLSDAAACIPVSPELIQADAVLYELWEDAAYSWSSLLKTPPQIPAHGCMIFAFSD